jgi:hypothetical protein
MTAELGGARRLDSWKAIAGYLNRDERTVRRWERELGLPVRRVPGGQGRSVFAYVNEVEEWLRGRSLEPDADSPAHTLPNVTSAAEGLAAIRPARSRRSYWLPLIGTAVVVLVATIAWTYGRRGPGVPARVRTTTTGVTAFDRQGSVQWMYPFSPEYGWAIAAIDASEPSRIFSGEHPGVYVATSFRARRSNEQAESGSIIEFSPGGKVQRTFSPDDTVSIGGTTYRPPWAITSFAIDESSGRRLIAVAAHHYVWNPGIVTILNDRFERAGTFVNDGWIEGVRWLAPNRLLVAGFSNAHDGGMAALLDPTAPGGINGQGPEAPGSPRFCTSCAAGAALKMVILPRSELNRLTRSPFNRVHVQVLGDRIFLRSIEVPATDPLPAADAIYEFTPNLDLVSAVFSDEYLSQRRTIRAAAGPSAARSAEVKPPSIQKWEPATGWTTIRVP